MGWATQYITDLRAGKTVQFRPHGNSMVGIISSGDLVTVEPIQGEDVEVGSVVLCKVKGSEYLHLVKATKNGMVLIGNNRGGVNGWTSLNQVYGRLKRST
jgi:hypothetical protein